MYEFWKVCPLKFGRAKKRPKFGAIFDNIRLWLRISPEWIDILQIWQVFYQPEPLPRWAKENYVNFGPQTKNYRGSYWPTQADILRETTFRPLKFLHALQIDRDLLAHITRGVYPYLPMATNAPWSILGEWKINIGGWKSLILKVWILCTNLIINNLQFTLSEIWLWWFYGLWRSVNPERLACLQAKKTQPASWNKKAQMTQGLRATAPSFQDGRQLPSSILSNRK